MRFLSWCVAGPLVAAASLVGCIEVSASGAGGHAGTASSSTDASSTDASSTVTSSSSGGPPIACASLTKASDDVMIAEALSAPAALTWFGDRFLASFTLQPPSPHTASGRAVGLSPSSAVLTPPGVIDYGLPTSDCFDPMTAVGPSGAVAVWSDRRDADYEIYASALDATGAKVGVDVRVTDAPEFSIYPVVAAQADGFVAAWQDGRDGAFQVYAQRVDGSAQLVGENVKISNDTLPCESPTIAASPASVAIAYTRSDTFVRGLVLSVWKPDLSAALASVPVSSSQSEKGPPAIVWTGDRYVVAWDERGVGAPGIYAASFTADGAPLAPATRVLDAGTHQLRYVSLAVVGDHVALAYASNQDENQGYKVYATLLRFDLASSAPEVRVTSAPSDSVAPTLAVSASGDLGVLYRDERDGDQRVYFSALACTP
ncbi:MAG: hypothetical protein U0414_25220 [Polyangiaceae bacterium]